MYNNNCTNILVMCVCVFFCFISLQFLIRFRIFCKCLFPLDVRALVCANHKHHFPYKFRSVEFSILIIYYYSLYICSCCCLFFSRRMNWQKQINLMNKIKEEKKFTKYWYTLQTHRRVSILSWLWFVCFRRYCQLELLSLFGWGPCKGPAIAGIKCKFIWCVCVSIDI